MADNHGYSKKYRNWVPGVGLMNCFKYNGSFFVTGQFLLRFSKDKMKQSYVLFTDKAVSYSSSFNRPQAENYKMMNYDSQPCQ